MQTNFSKLFNSGQYQPVLKLTSHAARLVFDAMVDKTERNTPNPVDTWQSSMKFDRNSRISKFFAGHAARQFEHSLAKRLGWSERPQLVRIPGVSVPVFVGENGIVLARAWFENGQMVYNLDLLSDDAVVKMELLHSVEHDVIKGEMSNDLTEKILLFLTDPTQPNVVVREAISGLRKLNDKHVQIPDTLINALIALIQSPDESISTLAKQVSTELS